MMKKYESRLKEVSKSEQEPLSDELVKAQFLLARVAKNAGVNPSISGELVSVFIDLFQKIISKDKVDSSLLKKIETGIEKLKSIAKI